MPIALAAALASLPGECFLIAQKFLLLVLRYDLEFLNIIEIGHLPCLLCILLCVHRDDGGLVVEEDGMRGEWAERYGLLLRCYVRSAALIGLHILRWLLFLSLAWHGLFNIIKFDSRGLLDGGDAAVVQLYMHIIMFFVLHVVVVRLEGDIHKTEAAVVCSASLWEIRRAGCAPFGKALALLLSFDFHVFIHYF